MASPSVADEPPSFKVTTKRDNDRAEFKLEKNQVTFVLRSPFGISSAVIERTGENWPKGVVLRLHLRGLESLKVSNGQTTLAAAVSSQSGKVRIWKDGNEATPLNIESPDWMPVRLIGSDGKQTRSVPLKDGYFEIKLPARLFDTNPQSITLQWIDFYRN